MPSVKVFAASVDRKEWVNVLNELSKRGQKVEVDYKPCDVAIVLGGRFNNPVLWKKRILFYNKKQWANWWDGLFGPVVEEYYDKLLDITIYTLEGVVEMIISEVDKQRGAD
jgi:hypothetical protein